MTTITRPQPLRSVIAALSPIDLASLDAKAALQSRIDSKYVLSRSQAERFIAALTQETAASCLEIEGLREFSYRSDYADTGDLDAYWASVRRSRFRFKVRTRHYLDSDAHWLEVKVRTPRGCTNKHRLVLDGRQDAFSSPFIADVLTHYGVPDAAEVASTLRPVVASEYRRSTLFLPESRGRLTIDSDLRWTIPGTSHLERRLPAVVIETKSAVKRSPADSLLASLGHRPARISKYATGMAVTHPELPANPWHRLLIRNGVTP